MKGVGDDAKICAEEGKPILSRHDDDDDEAVSYSGPEPSVDFNQIEGARGIWWGLFFCNMATLWAYQTLLTAQDVYNDKFPDADISFWGTVSYGIALVCAHVVQLVLGTEKHLTFRSRVIPGFILTAITGGIVIAFQKPAVILTAFALTGVLNTFISAPLYGIAGLFATGKFTGAVNIGNAYAGVLTVLVEAGIRLLFKASHSSHDPFSFTMYLFTGIMVAICLIAIAVFYYFTGIESCREKIERVEDQLVKNSQKFSIDYERMRLVWETIKELKYPAISQFWVFFISLGLWPGIPCKTVAHGWFADHGGEWLCSPFIIGAFNIADFLGRISCPWFASMTMENCMWLSLSRTVLIAPVIFCVDPQKIDSNWVLIGVLAVVGWSNGLLSTLSMMKGPRIARRPEIGAYVMVLFLYLGIACGAITAAVLNKAGWPK